ncbi:MAG: NAD(P)-binding domain-containing protein [Eubacterium sp.]
MVEFSKKEEVDYCESNNEVVKKAKYIILAVKPQMFEKVAKEIAQDITKENVLISLAPGITISQMGGYV